MPERDDGLDLPIFHDASLALALMDFTEAGNDDAEVQSAAAQRLEAREKLQKARRAHARAARAKAAVPKEILSELETRKARAEAEAEAVSTRLRDLSDQRLRHAKARRTEVLQQATAPPKDVDVVSDRLDRAEWQRRLEALPPDERALMVKAVAKDGTHPQLVRAALTAPAPPWPTASWQPMLADDVAQEVREWTIARRAPETVQAVYGAWRLRRMAFDLDMERAGVAHPGQPPTLAMLNMRAPLEGR